MSHLVLSKWSKQSRLNTKHLLNLQSSNSHYVLFDDAPQLNIRNEFSLAFVFMLKQEHTNNAGVITKFIRHHLPSIGAYMADSARTLGFGVYLNLAGGLTFQYSDGSATNDSTRLTSPALEYNRLYHFVWTVTALGSTLYMNGVEVADRAVLTTGDFRTPGTSMYFGKSTYNNQYADVALGQVMLFNKELSVEMVERLFSTFVIPPELHRYCQAYYPFDAPYGDTVYDKVEQFNYCKDRGDEIILNTNFRRGFVAGDGWEEIPGNWHTTNHRSVKSDTVNYPVGNDGQLIFYDLHDLLVRGQTYSYSVKLFNYERGRFMLSADLTGIGERMGNYDIDEQFVFNDYRKFRVGTFYGDLVGEITDCSMRPKGDYRRAANNGRLMNFTPEALGMNNTSEQLVPYPYFEIIFHGGNTGWYNPVGGVDINYNATTTEATINGNGYFVLYHDVQIPSNGIYEVMLNITPTTNIRFVPEGAGGFEFVVPNGISTTRMSLIAGRMRLHFVADNANGTVLRRAEVRRVRSFSSTTHLDFYTKQVAQRWYSSTGNGVAQFTATGLVKEPGTGLPRIEKVLRSRGGAGQSGSRVMANAQLNADVSQGYSQCIAFAFAPHSQRVDGTIMNGLVSFTITPTSVSMRYGNGNSNESYYVGGLTLNVFELNFFAFTADAAGSLNVYINGVRHPSSVGGIAFSAGNIGQNIFYIGEEAGSGYCFDAYYAVLAAWERELSSTEVKYLWNNGSLTNPTFQMQSRIIAYFTFNEIKWVDNVGYVFPNLLGRHTSLNIINLQYGEVDPTHYSYLLSPIEDLFDTGTYLMDEKGNYIVDGDGEKIII